MQIFPSAEPGHSKEPTSWTNGEHELVLNLFTGITYLLLLGLGRLLWLHCLSLLSDLVLEIGLRDLSFTSARSAVRGQSTMSPPLQLASHLTSLHVTHNWKSRTHPMKPKVDPKQLLNCGSSVVSPVCRRCYSIQCLPPPPRGLNLGPR